MALLRLDNVILYNSPQHIDMAEFLDSSGSCIFDDAGNLNVSHVSLTMAS